MTKKLVGDRWLKAKQCPVSAIERVGDDENVIKMVCRKTGGLRML